jgi:hypothetical protein
MMNMKIILEREIYFVKPKLTIQNSDIKDQRDKYIPSEVIRIMNEYCRVDVR